MTLFRKIVFIISAIAILILGMWFSVIWHQFICTPLYSEKEIKQAMTIQVSPGTGVHYLANHLYQRGLLQHPQFFIWLARLTRDASLLKAGEYQITQSTTPRDLLDNIAAGKVKQRSITFIEGWTFRQVKAALNENLHIKHTITTLTDQQIMTQLGHPDRRPEGLFFPDTYFFTWGDSDIKVLRESYQRMQTVLNVAWQRRAKNLAYKNPYQALIVASLVEKETALSKERSEIAGVILRRLKKRMLLQVDPTVLYGLGRPYYSRIKKEDLIKNTTYNTYQHCGLPPTPIDMPSYGSITAALNPAGGSTLYYVAQGDDGSHVFSATYKEHCQAVKKYRQEEAPFEWYNAVFKIDWRDGWKLNGVVLFHLRELKGLEKQQHLTMCARNLMRKVFLMSSHENRGGTPIAEAIRHILLDHYTEMMCPDTELLLMFAGRAQNIAQVVLPALRRGKWVLSDRFTDASFAYQGGGRGIPIKHIEELSKWVHGDLKPDIILLLDAPVSVGLSRVNSRGAKDRIEAEGLEFFERVRESYLTIARWEPQRFRVIYADQEISLVKEQILRAIKPLLICQREKM